MDDFSSVRFHELKNPINPVTQPELWQAIEATKEPFAKLVENKEIRAPPEEVLEWDVHFVATRETGKAVLEMIHGMPTWCRGYRKTVTGKTDRDFIEGRCS